MTIYKQIISCSILAPTHSLCITIYSFFWCLLPEYNAWNNHWNAQYLHRMLGLWLFRSGTTCQLLNNRLHPFHVWRCPAFPKLTARVVPDSLGCCLRYEVPKENQSFVVWLLHYGGTLPYGYLVISATFLSPSTLDWSQDLVVVNKIAWLNYLKGRAV